MDDEWPTCTICGAELPRVEITTLGELPPRYIPGRPCHPQPPTPGQLRASVDQEWLAHNRRLATDGY